MGEKNDQFLKGFFLLLSLFLLALTCSADPVQSRKDAMARCKLPLNETPSFEVGFKPVFPELSVPLKKLTQFIPPTKSNPYNYFVDHPGIIYRMKDGLTTEFLNISEQVHWGEQWGLQEAVFHPNFPVDPRVFLTYVGYGPNSTKESPQYQSRLSVFFANEDRSRVSEQSEVVLIKSSERHSAWHPVAGLKFGADGYLYVGWGEGNGLHRKKRLPNGKMLRIDVGDKNSRSYTIPGGNPNLPGYSPETFATGLRNPWRFSFLPGETTIIAGDVGERLFEEINLVQAGAHYGWPTHEGNDCLVKDRCDESGTAPLATLGRDSFCAVIGGYVYRGKNMPAYYGDYLFADFCTNSLWRLKFKERRVEKREKIGIHPTHRIVSFSEGEQGELFVIGSAFGKTSGVPVFEIVSEKGGGAIARAGADSEKKTLQDTNCLAKNVYTRVFPGFIPYSLAFPSFDNGATAYRSILTDSTFRLYGNIEFLNPSKPKRLIYIKNLEVDGRPIETQVIHKTKSGDYHFLDYAWNSSATVASLIDRPTTRKIGKGRIWQFSGTNGCKSCHNQFNGFVLGFRMSQINFDISAPSEPRNQYDILRDDYMLFKNDPNFKPFAPLPLFANRVAKPALAARAYLQVNCAHCHSPTGSSSFLGMDFRSDTPLSRMGICNVLGSSMPGPKGPRKRLTPANADESLITLRLKAKGSLAMPPGRFRTDRAGLTLLAQWIEAIDSCP